MPLKRNQKSSHTLIIVNMENLPLFNESVIQLSMLLPLAGLSQRRVTFPAVIARAANETPWNLLTLTPDKMAAHDNRCRTLPIIDHNRPLKPFTHTTWARIIVLREKMVWPWWGRKSDLLVVEGIALTSTTLDPHRQCYQRFTDETKVERAIKRCLWRQAMNCLLHLK